MTITRPWRRITLHFSHIFLTLGRTFTFELSSLVPVGDPASAEVVRSELHLHPVPGEDADVVHAHLPGDMRQHLVSVLQLNSEHGVGQRFDDGALEHDRVFLGLWDCGASSTAVEGARLRRESPSREPFMVAQLATVSTSGPSSVTAIGCSKWAERLPSAVFTVHPSPISTVPGRPAFTMGSTANTWPTRSLIPRPGSP